MTTNTNVESECTYNFSKKEELRKYMQDQVEWIISDVIDIEEDAILSGKYSTLNACMNVHSFFHEGSISRFLEQHICSYLKSLNKNK